MARHSSEQRRIDEDYIDLPWGVYEEHLVVNGEVRIFSVDNDKRRFEWRTVAVRDVDASSQEMWATLSTTHPKRSVAAAQVSYHLRLLLSALVSAGPVAGV